MHVNVINFVLITLLARVMLDRRTLLPVAGVCCALLLGIAWSQADPPPGEGLFEYRLETIGQFLPTHLVVVAIPWLREGCPAPGATE